MRYTKNRQTKIGESMIEKPDEKIIRRPKRWSANRKMEIVVRYIRGESLESLSREIGVATSQIETVANLLEMNFFG